MVAMWLQIALEFWKLGKWRYQWPTMVPIPENPKLSLFFFNFWRCWYNSTQCRLFFPQNSLKHSKVQTLQRLQHLPSPSLKLIFSWFTWERRGLILQNSWPLDLELLLPYLPLSAWLRPPLSPRRKLLSAQVLMDREMRSCRHNTLPWGIQPWWDTMKMSNIK